jgi:hypothetical protein
MADAKVGFETIKPQLIEEKVANRSYWRSRETVPSHAELPSVYLLPGFDEFVLGYSDRSDFLEAQHNKKITGINAVFAYTMVLNGQIVGTWKRTLHRKTVEIAFSPFAPLAPSILQAFAVEAERYGEFLNLPVTITAS